MNASTPLEFLQQARSIVQHHEQLKIAVTSLEQTLAYLESQPVCYVHLCSEYRRSASYWLVIELL